MAVLEAAPDISRHENPWALPNRLAVASRHYSTPANMLQGVDIPSRRPTHDIPARTP
jgi:hypothetical protein